MKNIFRTAIFMILAGLAALPWGCGSNSNSAAPNTPTAPSSPAYTYPFLLSFGGNGPGNGQFSSAPLGIAVMNGVVYVVDSGTVKEFDLNGHYLTSWASATGAFCGIAIDKYGYIYVPSAILNKIYKFDLNGNAAATIGASGGTTLGGLNSPYGIAVDGNLNVYVSEFGNNRVQVFDKNGTAVAMLPSSGVTVGSGNGQFAKPTGLALDGNGNLYVADFGNNRIEVLNTGGGILSYKRQFGSYGTSGNGKFNAPTDVAVDSDGNLLVCDQSNGIVQKLSPYGVYLGQVGSNGAGPGQFTSPQFAATDSNRDVFVSDYNDFLVAKFAPY